MEIDFILSNLCLPHLFLQEGMIKQILSDVTIKIQLSPPCSEDQKCIQLAINLLPYICDPEFSSLWLSLLSRLSSISNNEELNILYNQINLKQAELFPSASLPAQFLHCLWMSHLPSLEFSILMTLQKISEAPCFPNYILDMLAKSRLSEVAIKETLIYQTIFSIITSLLEQSYYPATLVEFLALFCNATRNSAKKNALNEPLIVMKSKSMTSLHSMFTFSPPYSSPMLVGKTLSKLYDTYVLCRDKNCENLILFNEDFWSLTVEYRHWMLAALNSILYCDQQDIQVCLWLLLAHNRINHTLSEYTIVKRKLLNFVYHLRSILHSPISSDNIHGFKENFNQLLNNRFSQKQEIVEKLILQILIVFIFHSKSGFRFGQEFIASQSSSQVMMAIKHLIYHYQLMPDLCTHWDAEKKTLFRKFIENTILLLDSTQCDKIIFYELESLVSTLT